MVKSLAPRVIDLWDLLALTKKISVFNANGETINYSINSDLQRSRADFTGGAFGTFGDKPISNALLP